MVPRQTLLAVFLFLISLPPAFCATKASCTFDTFDVPSGYTLNTVEGIGDDGTVVGQLIVNKTQAFRWLYALGRWRLHNLHGAEIEHDLAL